MVAASSKNSHQPPCANSGKGQLNVGTIEGDPSYHPHSINLPSIANCITHLRLLSAFSQLKETVYSRRELLQPQDSCSPGEAALRWIIFVAVAVTRFETWLQKTLPTGFRPSLARSTATNPSEMDKLLEQTEPLAWTQDLLPPLDVLLVLHSYMLNPHDFLQDCLRCGGLALWKAGFPWDLVATNIDGTTLEYRPSESTILAFEKRTGIAWNHMCLEDKTSIDCSGCRELVSVRWTDMYTNESLQMEKGNTRMNFAVTCPHCQSQVSQDSVCNARLKADLDLLLRDDVVLPGTLLSRDGVIPTACPGRAVNADGALLNDILVDGLAKQLIQTIGKAQRNAGKVQLSSCAMNDSIISAFTEGSFQDRAKDVDEGEKTFSALMKSAQRLRSMYDNNMSAFALDLVGAIMRQGAFVEKMQHFDWIRSPAIVHTVSCAIERYSGFFKVMQQHPGKTAVPTFDVDLVWHTSQLTPMEYYRYSLENCNGLFIDHDDKIVENVLNNSFEWTCEQFASLTGTDYDNCLCWCCAIVEQDIFPRRWKDTSNHSLGSRIKGMLKGIKRHEEPSVAVSQVVGIQSQKFEKDYAKARKNALESDGQILSKREFLEDYSWHYPAYAPYPEDVGVK